MSEMFCLCGETMTHRGAIVGAVVAIEALFPVGHDPYPPYEQYVCPSCHRRALIQSDPPVISWRLSGMTSI